MAWTDQKWINLRATAGYVADGTGQVCLPGKAGSTNEKRPYPESLTVNSDTFNTGYSTGGSTDGMRDRSTGTTNKQLAGAALTTNSSGSPQILKVELLGGTGDYEIRLAVGDPSGIGTTNPHVVIKDGTTTVATINGTAGIANWMDAGGTSRNDADWGTNNAALTLTFNDTSGTGSTPIMYIELGNTATAGFTPLASVGIKYVGGGATTTGRLVNGNLVNGSLIGSMVR